MYKVLKEVVEQSQQGSKTENSAPWHIYNLCKLPIAELVGYNTSCLRPVSLEEYVMLVQRNSYRNNFKGWWETLKSLWIWLRAKSSQRRPRRRKHQKNKARRSWKNLRRSILTYFTKSVWWGKHISLPWCNTIAAFRTKAEDHRQWSAVLRQLFGGQPYSELGRIGNLVAYIIWWFIGWCFLNDFLIEEPQTITN